MTVAIVMESEYDDHWVVGVYSSIDLAKAAVPGEWKEVKGGDPSWYSMSGNFHITMHDVDKSPEAQ